MTLGPEALAVNCRKMYGRLCKNQTLDPVWPGFFAGGLDPLAEIAMGPGSDRARASASKAIERLYRIPELQSRMRQSAAAALLPEPEVGHSRVRVFVLGVGLELEG